MKDPNTYYWKQFFKTRYLFSEDSAVNISTKNIQLDLFSPFFEEPYFITSLKTNYSSFTIDKKSKELIEDLIQHYYLDYNVNDLCALAVSLQIDYINYYENPINTFSGEFDDIENEYQEYVLLLELVQKQLFNTELTDFEKITFQFQKKYNFKSVFIFKDLMSTFIEYHGITTDNFSDKRAEILGSKSNLKLEKLAEFHKLKYIKGLYKILSSKIQETTHSDENLRFIACFLLLSQIPINQLASEFTLPSNHKDVVKSDINNLRKYIKGDKKIFY